MTSNAMPAHHHRKTQPAALVFNKASPIRTSRKISGVSHHSVRCRIAMYFASGRMVRMAGEGYERITRKGHLRRVRVPNRRWCQGQESEQPQLLFHERANAKPLYRKVCHRQADERVRSLCKDRARRGNRGGQESPPRGMLNPGGEKPNRPDGQALRRHVGHERTPGKNRQRHQAIEASRKEGGPPVDSPRNEKEQRRHGKQKEEY